MITAFLVDKIQDKTSTKSLSAGKLSGSTQDHESLELLLLITSVCVCEVEKKSRRNQRFWKLVHMKTEKGMNHHFFTYRLLFCDQEGSQ